MQLIEKGRDKKELINYILWGGISALLNIGFFRVKIVFK